MSSLFFESHVATLYFSMYPYLALLPPRTEIYVASTEKGMGTQGILEDTVDEPTEDDVEDSKIDENLDIMKFEKRDFDDEDGIEEDE
jgi:hypothetical protein